MDADADADAAEEDRAGLLVYVLETAHRTAPDVDVLWPVADRSATNATLVRDRRGASRPVDLAKVEVGEVLRCLREGDPVDLTEAVARVTGADRLKAWLPRLWDAREFRLDDRELTAMAYELLLCCTVTKGSEPPPPADEALISDVRVGCAFSTKRHRELLRDLQVLGADEEAAAKLGEPARVEPLRYRWLLLCATRPTREGHAAYAKWCRRQLVFLLASLLLHLRGAGAARRWHLPGQDYELDTADAEEVLVAAFRAPLRALNSMDPDADYSADRYEAAVSALNDLVMAVFELLARGRQQEGGEASAGLPVPSPLSLLLYERLLEVVLVGDEEVEDGDGGLHPEAADLTSLYKRCCWPALGLRDFEHGLGVAAVGYRRLVSRTESSARVGLLRTLSRELIGLQPPAAAAAGAGVCTVGGLPVWLPCAGGEATAGAAALAQTLLEPLETACIEQLSDCCACFAEAVDGSQHEASTSHMSLADYGPDGAAHVQAMSVLIGAVSRLRGEPPTQAEGTISGLMRASIRAFCFQLADEQRLTEGDPAEVTLLAAALEQFVTSGGFAAWSNTCLPTEGEDIAGRAGRGVQVALLDLGLVLAEFVNAVIDEFGSATLDRPCMDMCKQLVDLERALGGCWDEEVSSTQPQPGAFGGRTVAELMEPAIDEWVEGRATDWRHNLERMLQMERWETTGPPVRSTPTRAAAGRSKPSAGSTAAESGSARDLLEMLLKPARLFKESGLRAAATAAARGRFVRAFSDTLIDYTRAAAGEHEHHRLGLPALPHADMPVGEHLTRRGVTGQQQEARLGAQTFAFDASHPADAGVTALVEASLSSLAVRLNSLDYLVDHVHRHVLQLIREEGVDREGVEGADDEIVDEIGRGVERLREVIGVKLTWLGQRDGLLDGLYRTDETALQELIAWEKKQGGKKKVGVDAEVSCIREGGLLSGSGAGAAALDHLSAELEQLKREVTPQQLPPVLRAVFAKLLQLVAHLLVNFDPQRIFCVEDARSFEADLDSMKRLFTDARVGRLAERDLQKADELGDNFRRCASLDT